jgi:hypothetical protein
VQHRITTKQQEVTKVDRKRVSHFALTTQRHLAKGRWRGRRSKDRKSANDAISINPHSQPRCQRQYFGHANYPFAARALTVPTVTPCNGSPPKSAQSQVGRPGSSCQGMLWEVCHKRCTAQLVLGCRPLPPLLWPQQGVLAGEDWGRAG